MAGSGRIAEQGNSAVPGAREKARTTTVPRSDTGALAEKAKACREQPTLGNSAIWSRKFAIRDACPGMGQVAVTRELRLSINNIGDRQSARTRTVTESCPVRVSEHPVQRGEGPVNGGGNYDPLKVTTVALVKFGCMLGHLVSIPRYR